MYIAKMAIRQMAIEGSQNSGNAFEKYFEVDGKNLAKRPTTKYVR